MTDHLASRQGDLGRKVKDFFIMAGRIWNGISGADKYQKYLAHHRVSGCAHAPMTEREFWRDYTDRQD